MSTRPMEPVKPGEGMVNPQKTTTDSAVKQELSDYAGLATMHGVGQVANTNAGIIRRGVWLLMLTAAFVTCWTMVIQQTVTFFSYPVGTSETTVEVKELNFPTVTICNFNQIKKSVVSSDPIITSIITSIGHTQINWSDPVYASYADMNMNDISQAVAPTLNETLLTCYWQSQEIDCSQYFETINAELDICFSFNSRTFLEKYGPAKVRRRGMLQGLRVRLSIRQEEYTFFDKDVMAAGAYVVVHGPDVIPLVDEMGLPVSPGTQTHLIITQQQLKRLPEPYDGGGCLDTFSDDFKNPLEFFDFYTYNGCELECVYDFLEEACGCIPFTANVKNLPRTYCDLQQTLDCTLAQMEQYYSYYSDGNLTGCYCDVPCRETRYQVSQFTALFPSDVAIDNVVEAYNVTADYIRSNILELYVYYQDMRYTLLKQEKAYPLTSAIGDIGGQMGICLGMSALTLIEMAEVCIRIITRTCLRKRT